MIIDGKQIAAKVRAEVAQGVKELREQGIHPGLTVVRVGEDPASAIYVRGKRKDCEEVGIRSDEHHLPATTSQPELMALVARLNAAYARVCQDAELQRRMMMIGTELTPGSPEDFRDYQRREAARWGKLIREQGLQSE